MRVDYDRRCRNAIACHQEFFHFNRFTIWASEGITISATDDDEGSPAVFVTHGCDCTMNLVVGTNGRCCQHGAIARDHYGGIFIFGPVCVGDLLYGSLILACCHRLEAGGFISVVCIHQLHGDRQRRVVEGRHAGLLFAEVCEDIFQYGAVVATVHVIACRVDEGVTHFFAQSELIDDVIDPDDGLSPRMEKKVFVGHCNETLIISGWTQMLIDEGVKRSFVVPVKGQYRVRDIKGVRCRVFEVDDQ